MTSGEELMGPYVGRNRARLLAAWTFVAALSMPALASAANQAGPGLTFHKDVAPILREKCQACHAPGEMAPMPLMTYRQVRPWARAIRLKVSKRQMPPWFIDTSIGIQRYKNDLSLSDEQIDTIVKWIDAGMPEGAAPESAPAQTAAAKEVGWAIGKPDLILTKKPHTIYARGSDWWENQSVETGLTEDRWVKAVELRPGNRKIVHHFCSGLIPPGVEARGIVNVGPADRYSQEELEELQEAIQEVKLAGEGGAGASAAVQAAAGQPPGIGGGGFGCYLPGAGAHFYDDGTGVLLKAGSKITFTMHYSPSGEEGTDASQIGLVFHPKDAAPRHEVKVAYFQKFPAFELDLPPNSKVSFDAYTSLPKPTLLTSFAPHMHMRGNALVLEAILPTGRVQTISAVKNYNFAWQLQYYYADEDAPLLPAGTMLHAIVTLDNTSSNPYNPDPSRWVGYGQASSEEMAGTFVTWVELSPEEYRRMRAERRAAERANQSQQDQPSPR